MAIDLKAIRERCEEANPGAWVVRPALNNGFSVSIDCHSVVDGQVGIITLAQNVEVCDANFIAHAREDVPALLDEVDRLTTDRDRLLAALIEVRTGMIDAITGIDIERARSLAREVYERIRPALSESLPAQEPASPSSRAGGA